MADHADDDGGDDIFVYTGGLAPQHVTHVLIDKSVDVIDEGAFQGCENLVHVETHDGIREVEGGAFLKCKLLRRISLKSVAGIGRSAFYECEKLVSAELGDNLETIGRNAFHGCRSLEHLKLPSIIAIETAAFADCTRLTHIELSEGLETIGSHAFWGCVRLQRIVIPLKRDVFVYDDEYEEYCQFNNCEHLVKVALVGETHTKTVASLHMDSWRIDMIAEIDRINQVLPDTEERETTAAIHQWMGSVIDKIDHYRAEHCRFVKEAINLLELVLWKAKLDEKEDNSAEGRTKKAKVDVESARRERRVICGADIVIKNVLPFLKLE